MGFQPVNKSQALGVVLIVLLAADILLRFFGTGPVEATRISGRETDVAFHSLSSSNERLAASNQALAVAVQSLTTELRDLRLKEWAKAEEKLAEAQTKLAEILVRLPSSKDLPIQSTEAADKDSQ